MVSDRAKGRVFLRLLATVLFLIGAVCGVGGQMTLGAESGAEQSDVGKAPAGGDSTSPAQPEGGAELVEPPKEGKTIRGFRVEIRNKDTAELEAVVTGEQAVVVEEGIYRITAPVVVSESGSAPNSEDKGLSVGKVRLSARRGIYDEKTGIVRLFESVKAEGTDFDLASDGATYAADKKNINCETPVVVQRYRLDPEGNKVLAMRATGQSLDADVTLKKAVIRKNPVVTLFDVGEDFMGGGGTKPAGGGARQVVITSSGPLGYEHPARTVSFDKSVVATSGDTKLTCEKLVITLGNTEKTDAVQILTLTGEESVVLQFQTDTAVGDKLLWQNLTQAGVLTGSPARARTAELDITGGKLTFFKWNNRFQVEGPGKVVWSPPPSPTDSSGAGDSAGAGSGVEKPPAVAGPLSFNEQIEIVWKSSMKYDATEKIAIFSGAVQATQPDHVLLCDTLEILFEQAGGIKNVIAKGHVQFVQPGEGSDKLKISGPRAFLDAGTGMVKLEGQEGQEATIVQGNEKLVSSVAQFDPKGGSFVCSAPGELTMPGMRDEKGQPGEQIRVKWRKSMRFHREPPSFAEFFGDVEAWRADQKLVADALRVEFDDKMNPSKIISMSNSKLELKREPDEKGGDPQTKTGSTAEKPARERSEKFALPMFGSVGGAEWRLTGENIEGEPQKKLVRVVGPGMLELPRPDRPPDYIKWETKMDADFQGSYAYFEGEVDACFSGSALECGALRLEFNEKNELRHANAEKDVRFKGTGQNSWQLSSASAEAIFASGGVLNQLIAKKDVEVKETGRTLRAQLLKLFFEPVEGTKEYVVSRAEASINVRVQYEGEGGAQGLGQQLDWDRKNDTYRLTGKPAVVKRRSVGAEGPVILIDPKSGTMIVPKSGTPARTTVEKQAP